MKKTIVTMAALMLMAGGAVAYGLLYGSVPAYI